MRQEALHERRERLVELPLRLGGKGVEDQRRLAGAGNAREHCDLLFRNVQRHIFEVVLACADNFNELAHEAPGRRE